MAHIEAQAATSTNPNWDAGIYDMVPEVLMLLFVIAMALWARKPLKIIFESIAIRIRRGAAVQFGQFKLDEFRVSNVTPTAVGEIRSFVDENRERNRSRIYEKTNGTFLAVRLLPSEEKKQIYDCLIYVVRHKGKISQISRVEYYLGHAWGHQVFTSRAFDKRFMIVVSAYGPFLCLARVFFKDGQEIETWRYVDFNTGILPVPDFDAQ